MVRIRFRRVGKKKQPSFRLVAADKESPRDGRFLELLGFYNPRTEPATIKFKEDRIFYWISKGAQLSDSARQVMKVSGALDRYDRFAAGEDIEKLLQEAAASDATRNISDKTRHESPVGKPKATPAKEEPTAEVESADEAKAEVEVKEDAPDEDAKVETEVAEEAPAEEPKAKEEAIEETKTEEKVVEEPKAEVEKKAPAKEAKADAKEETKKEADAPAITSSRASIEKLELAANVTTALIEGDFKTIGKVAKQMETDTQVLLDLNGVGPKAIETIAEKLAAYTP